MGRYPISLAAAFLAGMLAGVLATAAWEPEPETASGLPAERSRDTAGASSPIEPTDAPTPVPPETESALAAVMGETQPKAAGSMDDRANLTDRLRELTTGWVRMQEELARLRGRVAGLEQRISAHTPATEPQRPERPVPPQDRRATLIEAGVVEDLAADIVWREGQYELDRLELRDQAVREGWFGSERYREEAARLEADKPDLRSEVGDDAYDRYLFAAGEDNRVKVNSTISGSPAEAAGLRAGDLIETYDGGRIFSFSGLRDATSDGERGELVPVDIRRPDGSRVQAWLPRGPLGVRLDMSRADPDA
jgi:hypothetical protein